MVSCIAQGVMFASIFFIYGVGLWYAGELIVKSRQAHVECYADPTASPCFSGGDAMLVRTVRI